jgi:hypothetical protein
MRAGVNAYETRINRLVLRLVLLLFALSALVACNSEKQIPAPPLILPFFVQQAGNKVEAELQVQEHRPYIIYLRLGFNKKDPKDRERVRKVAGDYGRDADGKLLKPGVSIPLRLKIGIIDASGNKTLLERDILEEEMWAYGADNFKKKIVTVSLKPGHYRISVETLEDTPELIGTAVELGIGYDHKTSTLPENK